MKKSVILCLIAVSVAFSAFVVGFYIGRNWKQPDVEISVSATDPAVSTDSTDSTQSSSETKLININTATKEELMTLPNIGETLAERIIAYRTAHGAFQNVTDIVAVEGIGSKTLAEILPYITIGG